MNPKTRKILDKQLTDLLREFQKVLKPRTLHVQLKHFPVNVTVDMAWEEDVMCSVFIASHTFRSLKNDPLVKSGLFKVREVQDLYTTSLEDYEFVDKLIEKEPTVKRAYRRYNAEIKAFCKKAQQFGELYFDDGDWFFDEYSVSNYIDFDLKGTLKYAKETVDDTLEYLNNVP